MKKLTAVLMLMTILFMYSCEKSESEKYNPEFEILNKNLLGDWIWLAKTGGFAGTIKTPASEGKNVVLTFLPDQKYSVTVNGVLQGEGNYYTSHISDVNAVEKNFIIFSDPKLLPLGNSPHKRLFEIKNDLLTMKDDYADGFNDTYTRKVDTP